MNEDSPSPGRIDSQSPSSNDSQSPSSNDSTPPEHEETFRERLREAAYEAERETGTAEATQEAIQHAVWVRLARTFGGFLLILVGLAALPLPGPGWIILIVGLTLLPYAWADRTVRLIRRNVPGVPEEGRIPTSTWIVMGVVLISVTLVSIIWGGDIADSAGDLWQSLRE